MKRHILALTFFLFLCTLFVLYSPRVATDLPYVYNEALTSSFSLPQTWVSGLNALGYYNLLTLWSWPMGFLYALGGKFGLAYSLLQAFLGFFAVFTICFFGIWKLLGYLQMKGLSRLAGTAVYVLNTYILLLIDGGQMSVAMAYGWLPVAYWLILKGLKSGLKDKILAAVGVNILVVFDIRFVFLLLLLMVISFVWDLIFNKEKIFRIRSYILLGGTSSVVVIGLNFYWLLPSLLAKAPSLPESYSKASAIFSFVELKHSLLMFQPHFPKNVFGLVSSPNKFFVFLPLIVLLGVILSKNKKNAFFWSGVGIIGIFLAKGSNPPFGSLYDWLFFNVPGFSFFRDSSKFFTLIALSYSILIASFFYRLEKFKNVFKLFFIGFSTYLLLLITPLFLGNSTGLFSIPLFVKENQNLSKYLFNDKTFGRVLWIPRRSNLGFVSPLHGVLEAERLLELRPFMISTIGSYETLNYLREGKHIGQLMDVYGVEYIAYPFPDSRGKALKKDEEKYYYTFSAQLSTLPWIENKIFDFPLSVFKTKSHQEKLFLARNIFYVVGSDKLYSELSDFSEFRLSQNAFVFLEEAPEIAKDFSGKIILFKKNNIDLAVTQLESNKFIFPATYLSLSPETESIIGASRSFGAGWWKRSSSDFLWLRNFLQTKYDLDNQDFDFRGGWAIAEGNKELRIKRDEFKKGELLLARLMFSPKGGKAEFWQGDQKVGEAYTKSDRVKVQTKLTGYKELPDQLFEYDEANFNWVEIGEIWEDGAITVKVDGEINIVNSLLTVSKEEWDNASKKTFELFEAGKVLDWTKLSHQDREKLFATNDISSLSFRQLSPTHYKVKIEGLDSDALLVFSESFDNLWLLDSQKPIKIYSSLNGFQVRDGEYSLYYYPQKFVLPGFFVTILMFTALAIWFLYTFFNAKSVK